MNKFVIVNLFGVVGEMAKNINKLFSCCVVLGFISEMTKCENDTKW